MALTPEAVTKLIASGFELAVERGAGTAARFTDEAYLEAGAELVAPRPRPTAPGSSASAGPGRPRSSAWPPAQS